MKFLTDLFNEINKTIFKLETAWLGFFLDSNLGYFIYAQSTILFFACRKVEDTFYMQLFFGFIFFSVFGPMCYFYILFKIPIARRYLEFLVGKQFIIDNYGKHTGSFKVVIAVVPVATVVAADYISKMVDNYTSMSKVEKAFEIAKRANHEKIPGATPEQVSEALYACIEVAKKPPESVLSKAITSARDWLSGN